MESTHREGTRPFEKPIGRRQTHRLGSKLPQSPRLRHCPTLGFPHCGLHRMGSRPTTQNACRGAKERSYSTLVQERRPIIGERSKSSSPLDQPNAPGPQGLRRNFGPDTFLLRNWPLWLRPENPARQTGWCSTKQRETPSTCQSIRAVAIGNHTSLLPASHYLPGTAGLSWPLQR